MRSRLILFARYPEPGTAKTRLIPALGPDGAAELQHAMTLHTLVRVAGLAAGPDGVEVEVRYAGGTDERMRALYGSTPTYRPQGDGDLGDHLARAAADAFAAGCRRVAVIGTDCPDLSAGIVRAAFEGLAAGDADVVLGPARDGGYYLIGLGRMVPELFRGVPWSTAAVLGVTLGTAHRLGLRVRLLPALADVDRPEDLPVWERVRAAAGPNG